MNKFLKRGLKISAITIGSVIVLFFVIVAIAVNFVFTPAKITPVVLKLANENLRAQVSCSEIDLTFFSTFPRFGLRLKDGNVVSKVIADSAFKKTDSLVSFSECILTVSPFEYFKNDVIEVHELRLKSPSFYAFVAEDGKMNWDIMVQNADTAVVDTSSFEFKSSVNLSNIKIYDGNLTFDDRANSIYLDVDGFNLTLKGSLSKEKSSVDIKFNNKNLIFWQKGELLASRIATDFYSKIDVDRVTHYYELDKTVLDVNGLKLGVKGNFKADTLARTIDVDVKFGMHSPSFKTVLEMIPESIVKKHNVTAEGDVLLNGNIKGVYGKNSIPEISFKMRINDASAQYKGLPYGIDALSADIDGFVDLMRNSPSFVNVNIFKFKGHATDIDLILKAEDILNDPRFYLKTNSVIDLNALSKTFPLQKGVVINGKLNANLDIKCKLSEIKKQDIGKIKVVGELSLNDVLLSDTSKKFRFSGGLAKLKFGVNNGRNDSVSTMINVKDLEYNHREFKATLSSVFGRLVAAQSVDTNVIAGVFCKVKIGKIKASISDTITFKSGSTVAKVKLGPQPDKQGMPRLKVLFTTDSMRFKAKGTKMALDMSGFDLVIDKKRDSVWIPSGVIGFTRVRVFTPNFPLPVVLKNTKISLGDRAIHLNKAEFRVGKSKITASGMVKNLAGALLRNELLSANLEINSKRINCNEIINAIDYASKHINITEESAAVITEDVADSTQLKLFVVPANVDFKFKTNIKKVIIGNMVFENVVGDIDVKDQTVNMTKLSMDVLGASMNSVVIYKASSPEKGYAGFDFNLKNIHVDKLIDFMPSLDTIVPMLKSFEGVVNFDIAAESNLDSTMNIIMPSLRSAMFIRGDSLVLMDGQTFAEISKMLMFKNKQRNLIDSISVNITVHDGAMEIYPFIVQMDRYKAAVGGVQKLDLSFNYHISILKSPLPFKAGIDVYGNPDKIKYKITKAKYKDLVTPAYIKNLDTARINLKETINKNIKKLLGTQ